MPEIIGAFNTVRSTISPLVGYVAQLRHLANPNISAKILRDRFGRSQTDSKKSSPILSAYVAQGLEFYAQGVDARPSVRPVLQYYAYLNLAVATILAYRPTNYEQHRKHGVEDRTHRLAQLELNSPIVTVRRGAVPLFHSIISREPLQKRTLRFSRLVAAIPMLQHELLLAFNKNTQEIAVREEVQKTGNQWQSVITFECKPTTGSATTKVTPQKLQQAMPLLVTEYIRESTARLSLRYLSKLKWDTEESAKQQHRTNCVSMINFGGHFAAPDRGANIYRWWGIPRVSLMPTLSASLFLAFSLACMARYRPAILAKAMLSPINLLLETFAREADGYVIPSLRNLLYREELFIGAVPYL